MQTVNICCAHCGNRWTVEQPLLAQPVHCPNCQQLVQSSAASEPALSPANDATEVETALPDASSPDVLSLHSGAASELPPSPLQDEGFESLISQNMEAALATETFASALPRRTVNRGLGSGVFIALVLIPLISYSILATIALVILLSRPPPRDPLEFLPDREGDLKGVQHQKQGAVFYDRVLPENELPQRLIVALGQAIQVGDVQVLPQKVELRRVYFRQGNFEPEPGSDDSLVLHVLVRNISHDLVFSPTDPFFDRSWKGAFSGKKPYTFLDIGSHRFWGGPLPWKPGQPPEERTTLVGQEYRKLQPGEQLTTFVCTDPEDHVGRLLTDYQGTLLWRVQVRRGLVQVGEREYPASAVIGVRFQDTDIMSVERGARHARLDRKACFCVRLWVR